jgi:hypothetical protein
MKDAERALEQLTALHRRIDAAAGRLARLHGPRLKCRRGCADCCRDDLTVFAVEAERIRREFPDVLAQSPRPAGACAFLDPEDACRIYPARPYVCRTQGLPLRYFEIDDGGEVREYRDICPLNEPDGLPLVELPAAECWQIGPPEEELAGLQQLFSRRAVRIPLRDLFR